MNEDDLRLMEAVVRDAERDPATQAVLDRLYEAMRHPPVWDPRDHGDLPEDM